MTPEIQTEYNKCIKAIEAQPDAKSAWCCHHEVLWEFLTEPYGDRIWYILNCKNEWEWALRFRNFRPCSQHALAVQQQEAYDRQLAVWAIEFQKQLTVATKEYEVSRDALPADQYLDRDLLLKAHRSKVREFEKAYDVKYTALVEEYNNKRLELYRQDVPEGTWNGATIFK